MRAPTRSSATAAAPILPTYDAIFTFNEEQKRAVGRQVALIVPANEQGAGFMAAGYARASGRVGVCLVTSGPGATNTVTPVRDCMADSVPIVVICGQVATASIGTDAFQEAPVASMMGSIAKHVFLVTDPARLEATMRTAFEIARTGRPGPVVVDIPKDVQTAVGVFRGEGTLADPGLSAAPARADLERARRCGGGGFLRAAGSSRSGRCCTRAAASSMAARPPRWPSSRSNSAFRW